MAITREKERQREKEKRRKSEKFSMYKDDLR